MLNLFKIRFKSVYIVNGFVSITFCSRLFSCCHRAKPTQKKNQTCMLKPEQNIYRSQHFRSHKHTFLFTLFLIFLHKKEILIIQKLCCPTSIICDLLREAAKGGGVKGRTIKEKITFFLTFFFQRSKISTAINLEGGRGFRP